MAEIHRELSSVLRERSVFSNVLDKIEAKAKLKREWLVYAFAALTVLLYVFKIAGPGMTHFITTFWPILGSLRAMDRQSPDLQQKWLGYWIIYASLNTFEWLFVGFQRVFRRVYLVKLLVLAACAAPHHLCPARLVYAKLLRHRVWLDGGGTAQGGYSQGASSAAHPPAASTFTVENTETASTARATPKKASSGGKPHKGK